jgi:tetratricopeptide (TPR) repeat protein
VYRVEQALLDELERPDAARRAAALALSTAQRLRDRDPGNVRWREAVAAAEFHVALAAARPDKIEAWQRVRAAYEALLAERPDDPTRLRNAALAAKYLGGAFDFDGQTAAALEHYRRALALDERQLALAPDDEQARFDVAIDLSNVAGGLMSEGKPAEAVILYERSVALRQQMAAADPDDDRARSRLLVARIKLAYCYFALRRHADAARLLDVVEPQVADPPGRSPETWRLIERTRVLSLRADLAPPGPRRCGLYRQALAVWAEVAAREPLTGVNAVMRDEIQAAVARCATGGPAR